MADLMFEQNNILINLLASLTAACRRSKKTFWIGECSLVAVWHQAVGANDHT